MQGLKPHRRYKLIQEIGSGGMAFVWLGEDKRFGVQRALKILQPHVLQSDIVIERFKREAELLMQLAHPNVITLYDVGAFIDETGREHPMLIMELAKGSLDKFVGRGTRLPDHQLARAMIDVLETLAYIHEAGVIHRDIKPGNILIDRWGVYKLSDFGVAQDPKHFGELTGINLTMGSGRYLSPESFKAAASMGPRADIFALGITILELASGNIATPGTANIAEQLPNFIDSVPPPWREIVRRAIRVNPDDRFQTAEEMLATIREATGIQTSDPRPIVILQEAPTSTTITTPRHEPTSKPLPPPKPLPPFRPQPGDAWRAPECTIPGIAMSPPADRRPFIRLSAATSILCFLCTLIALFIPEAERSAEAAQVEKPSVIETVASLIVDTGIIPPLTPTIDTGEHPKIIAPPAPKETPSPKANAKPPQKAKQTQKPEEVPKAIKRRSTLRSVTLHQDTQVAGIKVWLADADTGEVRNLGATPKGRYFILADFGNGRKPAGEVDVTIGAANWRVKCVKAFQTCTTEHR